MCLFNRESCFNAPANTSYSFTLLRIISWSLQYNIFYFKGIVQPQKGGGGVKE